MQRRDFLKLAPGAPLVVNGKPMPYCANCQYFVRTLAYTAPKPFGKPADGYCNISDKPVAMCLTEWCESYEQRYI